MNCQIFRQLLFCQTMILGFITQAVLAVNFDLPDTLIVESGGRQIQGYQGEPEEIHNIAKELVANPESQQAKKFPAEGFVYKKNDGALDGFEIAAWSSNGKKEALLKAVREKLLRSIDSQSAQNEKPAGFSYSAMRISQYGKSAATAKTLPVQKNPQGLARVQRNRIPSQPLLFTASLATNRTPPQPVVVQASLGDSATATTDAASLDWKAIFLFAGILLVLLLAIRFGILA